MVEIQVEYNLNADDIVAYILYTRLYSIQAKRSLKKLSIISLVFAILAGLYSVFSWPEKMMAIPALVFCVCMIHNAIFSKNTIKKQIPKWVNWRYGKGQDGIIGNHKITLTEEKLTDINEKGESTIRWGVIENIILTEKHMVLVMRASTGFYIVPKKAFSNDADFNQFVNTAQNFHQTALKKRNSY
jgi:hypothetical protein